MVFFKKYTLVVSLLVSLFFGTGLYLVSISGRPDGTTQSSLEVAESIFDRIRLKRKAVSDLYDREDGWVAWSTLTTWMESSAVGVFYPVLGEQGFSIFLQGEGPFRKVFRSRHIAVDPNSKYFVEWSINPVEPHDLKLKLLEGDRETTLTIRPGTEENIYYFQPASTTLVLELHIDDELIPTRAGEVARIKYMNVMRAK